MPRVCEEQSHLSSNIVPLSTSSQNIEQASVSIRLASSPPAAKIAELLLAPVKREGYKNVCCWNFSHTLKHKMDSSPFSTGERGEKTKKQINKQTDTEE